MLFSLPLALAYGVNRYSSEVYTVQSTILIKDEQYGGGFAEMDKIIPGGDIFGSKQNLQNEIGILKSFDLNHKVMYQLSEFHVVYIGVGRRGIAETRLYNNSPFVARFDSIWLQPAGIRIDVKINSTEGCTLAIEAFDYEGDYRFGERFNRFGFDFTLEPRSADKPVFAEGESNKYYFWFTTPASLANQYRSKLIISPIEEEATLVSLSVSGPSREQEADYLNALMQEYIQQGLDWKGEAADSTIRFIDRQLGVTKRELTGAEQNMETFRLDNRFVDLTTEGTLVLQRLERYENEKTVMNLQMQYYVYLNQYLKSRNEKRKHSLPQCDGRGRSSAAEAHRGAFAAAAAAEAGGFRSARRSACCELTSKIEQARASLLENVKNSRNQLQISME